MKNILSFSLVALGLSLATNVARANDVDFDSLVPAEDLAAEMQADTNGDEAPESARVVVRPGVPVYPVPVVVPVPVGPYPYPQPYPYGNVVCYAQNIRGQVFSALGYEPISTQNAALSQCTLVSVRCAPKGCGLR